MLHFDLQRWTVNQFNERQQIMKLSEKFQECRELNASSAGTDGGVSWWYLLFLVNR